MTTASPSPAAGPTLGQNTPAEILADAKRQLAAALQAEQDNAEFISANEANIAGLEGEVTAAQAIIASKATVANKRAELARLAKEAAEKKARATDATQQAEAEAARQDFIAKRQAHRADATEQADAVALLQALRKKSAAQAKLNAIRDAQAKTADLEKASKEALKRVMDLESASANSTPADSITLSQATKDNAGKADNFKVEDIQAITALMKTELKRPDAWGDHFKAEANDEADQVKVWNDGVSAPDATSIVINPTAINIHGKLDDTAIQAALIAADKLWRDKGGIQIKTLNPRLKARILANAAHLKQMGKIEQYKTRTLFGLVGEGFKDAKFGVTAIGETRRRFGILSTHNHRMDCLRNGIESDTSRFTKWQKLKAQRLASLEHA